MELFYCLVCGLLNPLVYILYYLICLRSNINHLYALYIVVVLNTTLLIYPLNDLFNYNDIWTVSTLLLNIFTIICVDIYFNKRSILPYFITYVIFFILSINIYDSLNLGAEYDMYIILFIIITSICFILLYKYMQVRKREKVALVIAYTTKYIALYNPKEEDLYDFIYDILNEVGMERTVTNCMLVVQQLRVIEQGTLSIVDKYKVFKDIERKMYK